MMKLRVFPLLVAIAALPLLAAAQTPGPEPVPYPAPVAAPVDTPYPGTISLLADVTDTAHRIVHVTEQIPVQAGALTLLYPQWIPGNHSPTGPISRLTDLRITASGARIPWVRGQANVYAFHLQVPDGVTSLQVEYYFLAPLVPAQGRISFDGNFIDLSWNTVVLYPAGHFSRDIQYAPAIALPAGWKYATALTTAARDGSTVHFARVPLNTLVDSPLYAGVNYKRINLSTGPDNIVHLNVFADTAADLAITPEELALHQALAVQAQRLFASHHYTQYNFLFSLSNTIGGEGLEHHQSSEDGTRANYFTDWAAGVRNRDLLAHEYTHSWNGKFRRPNDLWTPNFNVPMRDDLLWVYEGLTQYWGYVLTARSGMRSLEATRDLMAGIAANFAASPGRTWRPLVDTTNQPSMSQRSPQPWASMQRGEDYYQEGLLIWLDADTKIRELSHGAKSLDDFAKLFYGVHNGSYVTDTYDLNDIVAALNQVQPYDWMHFLQTRVYQLHPAVPVEGFTQGGWRLAYTDQEPRWMRRAPAFGGASFSTSLGLSVARTGMINNVWWGSPAFKAGLAQGMKLLAVNGTAFTAAALTQAILAAEHGAGAIHLLYQSGDAVKDAAIAYRGGLRIPILERIPNTPDRLDAILAPVR